MASRRIEEQIDGLVRLRGSAPAAAAPALRKGLADRSNIVVAKAAQIAAELPAPEVLPDLLRSFDRFFQDPTKSDPQCWGKNAIARALLDLGHRDSAVYLRGAVHVQLEGSWGGHEDTAGPLRGVCLLALPGCPDLTRVEVLRHLVNALTESNAAVRADAARAFAEMQGEDCALLLRLKARTGDPEAAVLGQVFEALLAIERRVALPFIRTFLTACDAVAEEAALALGGSRQSEAAGLLMEVWPDATGAEYRQAILRALSISRQDQAIEFLRDLVANGRTQDAADARAALALFREDK